MDLGKKIEADLIDALKGGNSQKVSVFRMIKAAFKNKEIEKRSLRNAGAGGILTEDEMLSILNREVKKRKEAIVLFKKGGRSDLADKESQELKIIEEYLPEALGEDKIEAAVNSVLKGKNYGFKDFGLVMKEVMKELKGKVAGDAVSRIIKEKLEK